MEVNIIISFDWKISFVWLVTWILQASERKSVFKQIEFICSIRNKKGKKSEDREVMAPNTTIWKYCLE